MCRGCGTRKEEWERDRFAYVGDVAHCPGCELLAQEQEHLRDMEEKGAAGLTVRLVPKALATAPKE